MPTETRELRGKKRLQASARPVDVYSRPTPQAVQGPPIGENQFTQLARSLSNFSVPLGNLAAQQQQKEDKRAKIDAIQHSYGISDEDLNKAIKNNEDTPDSVYKATVQSMHGNRIGNAAVEDLLRRAQGENTAPEGEPSNAFDRYTGNLDEFWLSNSKKILEEIGESPEARIAANNELSRGLEIARRNQLKFTKEEYHASSMQSFYEKTYNTIDSLIEGGETDVTKIHAEIRKIYPEFKQHGRLTSQEMDHLTFLIAEDLAKNGKADLVRELILGKRDGSGPLGRKKEYAKRATSVLELAERERKKRILDANKDVIALAEANAHDGTLDNIGEFTQFLKDNPSVVSSDEVTRLRNINESAQFKAKKDLDEFDAKQKLIRASEQQQKDIDNTLNEYGANGTLQGIPEKLHYVDETGNEKTYTHKQLKERAVQNYLAKSDRLSEANNETPEQKLAREVWFFAENGVINPRWKHTLNTGFAGANIVSLTQDEVPPNLLEGVALYKELNAKSPLVLKKHLKDESARTFYNLVSVAEELGHGDTKQALLAATTAMQDVNEETAIPKISLKEIQEVADDVADDGWIFSNAPKNQAPAQADMLKLANLYTKLGMSKEDAIERANERVSQDYTNIHGSLVKTSSVGILAFPSLVKREGVHPNNVRSFKKVYEDYAAKISEGSESESEDLQLVPNTRSEGSFIIIDKNTGLPFSPPKDRKHKLSVAITVNQLAEFEANRILKLSDKTAKDVVKEAAKDDNSKVKRDLKRSIDNAVSDTQGEFLNNQMIDSLTGSNKADNSKLLKDGT